MKTNRSIKKVIPSQKVDMGGHLIDQPLPIGAIDQIDPFLLIHHWKGKYKGGQKQQDVGVGPHPHRGFSPVTFVFKGSLHHRDSLGNSAVVTDGGTQWMHAGSGITHSERPSKKLAEDGGESEFIQFWVNTPSKHKMEIPYYKPLSNEDTPKIQKNKAVIGVVAGEMEGINGAVKTYSSQTLLRVEALKEAHFNLEIPSNYNCLIYQLEGELTIDNIDIIDKNLVWFENDSSNINIQVNRDSTFIVLSGEPIDEEVTSYGPFVMNSQTEILEALRDAQMGKMGILIEDFN